MTNHAIFHRPQDASVPAGHDPAIFGIGCDQGIARVLRRNSRPAARGFGKTATPNAGPA